MAVIRLALAPFLRSFPQVITLGIRGIIDEYTVREREWISRAHRIFFPSIRFAEVFHAGGRPCFPSVFNYRYQRSRILQLDLVKYLDYPHPRTRIYYGTRQKRQIPQDFRYPFLLMGPAMQPETEHLVSHEDAFLEFSRRYNPVLVREMVEWRERFQMICVQFQCLALLRYGPGTGLSSHPDPAFPEWIASMDLWRLSQRLLQAAHLDDMMLEWGYADGRWQFIEMKRPPVNIQSPHGKVNRHHHIGRLIQQGIL